MKCPNCDRTIPGDAVFCIYCAAPAPKARPVAMQEPATGATIRLDPAQAPMVTRAPAPSSRHQPKRHRHHRKHRHIVGGSDSSGMLFIIGIFVLIATRSFWPGIFVLIGLTNFYKKSVRGHTGPALREIVFWIGFALLIATGTFWPGIILLVIASSLIRDRGWGHQP